MIFESFFFIIIDKTTNKSPSVPSVAVPITMVKIGYRIFCQVISKVGKTANVGHR